MHENGLALFEELIVNSSTRGLNNNFVLVDQNNIKAPLWDGLE